MALGLDRNQLNIFVKFDSIKQFNYIGEDIEVQYCINSYANTDFGSIGLFRVGWSDVKDYVIVRDVKHNEIIETNDYFVKRRMTFSTIYLLSECCEESTQSQLLYEFCYLYPINGKSNGIFGTSNSFFLYYYSNPFVSADVLKPELKPKAKPKQIVYPNRSVGLDLNEYKCTLCYQLFVNPVFTPCCSQTYCSKCVDKWLKSNNTCPYDRQPLNRSQLIDSPIFLINLLDSIRNTYRKCQKCGFRTDLNREHNCIKNLIQRIETIFSQIERMTEELSDNESEDRTKILSKNSKKSKESFDTIEEVITEEAVRRYITRRPMSALDLIRKFIHKVFEREKVVDRIAQVLQKLEPKMQIIDDKYYFSLNQT